MSRKTRVKHTVKRSIRERVDERVAGVARSDRQMWDIVSGVDRERVATDVCANLEAALVDGWPT